MNKLLDILDIAWRRFAALFVIFCSPFDYRTKEWDFFIDRETKFMKKQLRARSLDTNDTIESEVFEKLSTYRTLTLRDTNDNSIFYSVYLSVTGDHDWETFTLVTKSEINSNRYKGIDQKFLRYGDAIGNNFMLMPLPCWLVSD